VREVGSEERQRRDRENRNQQREVGTEKRREERKEAEKRFEVLLSV
jgi:hypothetical protein